MILVRSILFNILFYLNLLVYFIAAIPTFFLPYRAIVAFAKAWGRTSLWLVRAVCGIEVEWIRNDVGGMWMDVPGQAPR